MKENRRNKISLKGVAVLLLVLGIAVSPSLVGASQIVDFGEASILIEWSSLADGSVRYDYTLTNNSPPLGSGESWYISQLIIGYGLKADPGVYYAPIGMGTVATAGVNVAPVADWYGSNDTIIDIPTFLTPGQTLDPVFLVYESGLYSQEISLYFFDSKARQYITERATANYPVPEPATLLLLGAGIGGLGLMRRFRKKTKV